MNDVINEKQDIINIHFMLVVYVGLDTQEIKYLKV